MSVMLRYGNITKKIYFKENAKKSSLSDEMYVKMF